MYIQVFGYIIILYFYDVPQNEIAKVAISRSGVR